MIKIAPSILSADLIKIKNEIEYVVKAGADIIHIDIMDGQYVPNITFGPNIVRALKSITHTPLDVHLMIANPDKYFEEFIEAGSDIISFHPETVRYPEILLKKIKKLNCKPGLAIHPKIKILDIQKLLYFTEIVNVLTVIPGFGGQKFLNAQISKITELNKFRKKENIKFEIEIDGGINNKTAKWCIDKGADILVAGSYIYGAKEEDYGKLIKSLRL